MVYALMTTIALLTGLLMVLYFVYITLLEIKNELSLIRFMEEIKKL